MDSTSVPFDPTLYEQVRREAAGIERLRSDLMAICNCIIEQCKGADCAHTQHSAVGSLHALTVVHINKCAECKAAPELLEALKFYVAICGNTCYQVDRQTAQELHDKAQIAITKAEGQS